MQKIFGMLTPKGRRSFFYKKNTSNLPFLAQEAQTKKNKFFIKKLIKKIAILTIRS
jgi:hypothetical protein